jgi:hypothetical protein
VADRQLYLGIVERLYRRSDGHHAKQRSDFALLRPLCKASADFSEWLPVDNAEEDFPNRGFITWYAVPKDIEIDSVWQFRTEESFTYEKDNPEHDRFFAAKSPAPAQEVIDWRRDDQPYESEIVRRDVVDEGIWLSHPPSPFVYLWVDDHTFIGPVHLWQHGEKWRVRADQTLQRPVGEFSIPKERIAELRIAGAKRFFLTPSAQTGAPVRLLDWSTDDIVLKRVLQWLKKADAGYASAANLTKEAVNRAASLARSEVVASGEAALLTHRLQRALALVSTLEENSSLAQAIQADLLNLPSASAIINGAADAERQRVRDEIRAELASEISQVNSLRATKNTLEEKINGLENKLTEIAEEVSRKIEESRSALEEAMAEQLSDVMSRPAHAVANIAILRLALGLNEQPGSSGSLVRTAKDAGVSRQIVTARVWHAPNDSQVNVLSSQDDLQQSLSAVFESKQFDPIIGRTLHATFMAGAMPVLAGDASYEAVECYASCVAGGRLLWIPVLATVFEPGDLLGRFEIKSKQFMPHPSGLVDLLLHAHSSDEFYIVVLDGINRAPIDAYLNPILSIYSDVRLEEHRRRKLPLLPAGVIGQDAPYAAAARLAWPPNVLLAGIWSEGTAGLPTPPAFWDASTLISVEQSIDADGTSSNRKFNDSTTSTVSLTQWSKWRAANQEKVPEITQILQKLLKLLHNEGFLLSRKRAAMCGEFYAAVSQWLQNDVEALHDTALFCLAPRMLASGSDYHLLLEAVERVSGAAGDLEARLRRALLLLS